MDSLYVLSLTACHSWTTGKRSLIWLLFPPAVGLMFVWFCLLIADVFMTKRKRHYMLGKLSLSDLCSAILATH
jgi:hypothetical protein